MLPMLTSPGPLFFSLHLPEKSWKNILDSHACIFLVYIETIYKYVHLNSEQLTSTFCFMLNFLQWTTTLNIVSKCRFLYLNIHGLRLRPGKFFVGVLEKSWSFFVSDNDCDDDDDNDDDDDYSMLIMLQRHLTCVKQWRSLSRIILLCISCFTKASQTSSRAWHRKVILNVLSTYFASYLVAAKCLKGCTVRVSFVTSLFASFFKQTS